METVGRLFGALVALCLVGALAGCTVPNILSGTTVTGSGRTTTQEYDFTGFNKVVVSHAFQATVTRGDAYRVAVTVDDNLVEYLDVRVDGDTLRIQLKPVLSLGFRNTTLRAEVTLPSLAGLDLSGATRTQLSGFTNSEQLDVEISGASQLRGNVTVSGATTIRASGASTLELTGSSASLNANASGASTVRLQDFPTGDARVDVSGASNITVNAKGRITGEASGASSVKYTGNPASVLVDTSGASSVRQQ